jgi:hypothetical protein
MSSTSASGYFGVVLVASGRYVAQIYDGSQRGLGTYDSAIEAALVYDTAAIEAGKSPEILNFPPQQSTDQKEESANNVKKRKREMESTTSSSSSASITSVLLSSVANEEMYKGRKVLHGKNKYCATIYGKPYVRGWDDNKRRIVEIQYSLPQPQNTKHVNVKDLEFPKHVNVV